MWRKNTAAYVRRKCWLCTAGDKSLARGFCIPRLEGWVIMKSQMSTVMLITNDKEVEHGTV